MIAGLGKIPVVSHMAFTRGWYFIIAWCHRISGFLLVLFAWLHIYGLGSWVPHETTKGILPAVKSAFVAILVWLMAVPMIFHVLNGGRLMLYESFGRRNDEAMVRWVLALAAMYLGMLGVVMVLGSQTSSPFLFWLCVSLVGLVFAYAIGSRLWKTDHKIFWKLQRISGAYMVPTVPGYVLSLYVKAPGANDVDMATATMQSALGKPALLVLLLCVVYHGAYGLFSVLADFVASRWLKAVVTVLIILTALTIGAIGVKVIVGA